MTLCLVRTLPFLLAALVLNPLQPMAAGEFRAGAAQVGITPENGMPMAGFYRFRGVGGVLDPLYVKTILMEQNGRHAALVVLDLALKEASPFKHTIIAELANGSIGYVPDRAAYPQGNYEIVSARCAQGSGEMLIEAALLLLEEAAHP